MWKKLALAFFFAFVFVVFGRLVMESAKSQKGPMMVGELKPGILHPCPDKPNCVSSQADKASSHYIEPFSYNVEDNKVASILNQGLASLKGTKVVDDRGNYLRAESTTTLLRFVDDIELVISSRDKLVHVRSASRVGHSDMGANRKRVEKLRLKLKDLGLHSQ